MRIAYRALVLLVSSVMLVALIAARPADPAPRPLAADAPRLPQPRQVVAAAVRPRAPDVGLSPADEAQQLKLAAARERRLALRASLVARIPGDGPRMRGELVAQTDRLDLYAGKNSFSAAKVAELAPAIEQALRAAERRLGTRLSYRVSVGFYRLPPKRGVRGMAYTSERRAELFYRPGESAARALTIAAHELAHHLEAQRYGEQNQRLADTILHEGMATWIAADRWLPMCEAGSWRQRARQLGRAGIPLRLNTERYGADNAYELWASFVDFLIERYGWDAYDELYASGRGRAIGSANYARVLGKSLDELADEWREWVGEF